jgi:hypothetical protein
MPEFVFAMLSWLVAGTLIVTVVNIARRRLFDAYIARYGDSRGRWQGRFSFTPDGSWNPGGWRFYLQHFDDPLVERRRREYLLAWIPPLVFIDIPIALAR